MSAVTTCLRAMQHATLDVVVTKPDRASATVLRLAPQDPESSPRWLTSACASSSLFVRPCYPVLYLLVTTFFENAHELQEVVVTGSHGMGKRSFLSYVFFQLRQLPSPPTIVFDVPGCYACVAPDGTVRLGDRGTSFQSELADRSTFYLCDAASVEDILPLRARAKTLVVMPPTLGSGLDAFSTRDSQRITFVMPTWSMAELEACRQVSYPLVSRAELAQRQEMWGGLIRWALAEPLAVATTQFATLCNRTEQFSVKNVFTR